MQHVRLPPRAIRAEINERLHDFFAEHDTADFREAVRLIVQHYGVTRPLVRWRRSIDRHQTLGLTYSSNRVHLYQPKHWVERPEGERSEREWIQTFWHEMYHVLTIVREEERADYFARLAMED